MRSLLLLVNSAGEASAHELRLRQLREFQGDEGVSVHFRPVRNDALFESAKNGSRLAYRVLLGEGIVRSQLWVEYEVGGPNVNVTGRSAELLFALTLVTSLWKRAAGDYPAIAATGVLNEDDTVGDHQLAPSIASVARIGAKLAAAARALAGEREAVIFYPATDQQVVENWRSSTFIPSQIRLQPVIRLDDALGILGIELESVYLGNPYRGLECFDYAHRSVFFGRDSEVREVTAQLLRREALGAAGLLVEGASGSGKSSFLRAGVLPALVNPGSHSQALEEAIRAQPVSVAVRLAIWHPALSVVRGSESSLARSIHSVWRRLPELAADQSAEATTFEELLQRWRSFWPSNRRFVWVADQLEELFAIGLPDNAIEAFGTFLVALQSAGAWTLASIRADAMPTLKRYASLRTAFGSNEGQYYLGSLGLTALDDVICRPARAAGLTFEHQPNGKRLDQTLREDAYRDHENALPLLQLTLHELYHRRTGRELTYAAYDALGGLSGAVATIATTALARTSYDGAVLSRLFRNLVSVDESGSAIRRYALQSDIAQDKPQGELLVALVNARLCVSDQRDGHAVAALAHEAVLRTWPELAAWLNEESRLLQLRDLAEHDARLWQQQSRAEDWLAAPSRLAALERLEHAGVRLSDLTQDFIAHSRRRKRRSLHLRQAGVSAAVLLALAASINGIIAVSKQHEAQYEAATAVRARNRAMIEANTARATAHFLASIFNAPTPRRSLGRSITARQLLDAGARRLRTRLFAAPEIRARLTEQIGNAYRELGEYRRAGTLLKNAIGQYLALPHAPAEYEAAAYTALGRLYYATDNPARARRTLRRAMILESSIAAERRSPAPFLVYAQMEMGEGKFSVAKTALSEAGEILHSRAYPANRDNYLLLIQESRLYQQKGDYERARQFGLRALAAEARILGPNVPAAITADDNLDSIYQGMNNATMALTYGRRALTLGTAIYGKSSRAYTHLLANYAVDLEMSGGHGAKDANREAEKLFRQILATRLRTLGRRHQYTGTAYYDIATAAAARGQWAKALPLILHARRIWQSAEGRDSPDMAFVLAMEARILTHLGRPQKAVALAERALHIVRQRHMRNYGVTNYVVSASTELRNACFFLARHATSISALPRVLKLVESSHDASKEMVVACLDSYARALGKFHQVAAAKAAFARASTIGAAGPLARASVQQPQSN